METEEIARFSVSIPKSLLDEFDKWLRSHGMVNRSEALRQVMRSFIAQSKWEFQEGMVCGTVTIIYDHHRHDIGDYEHTAQIRRHNSLHDARPYRPLELPRGNHTVGRNRHDKKISGRSELLKGHKGNKDFYGKHINYNRRTGCKAILSVDLFYYKLPMVATITALIVCSLFSASSKTLDWADSKTSSVTSLPLTAGKQCKNMASLSARSIKVLFT